MQNTTSSLSTARATPASHDCKQGVLQHGAGTCVQPLCKPPPCTLQAQDTGLPNHKRYDLFHIDCKACMRYNEKLSLMFCLITLRHDL